MGASRRGVAGSVTEVGISLLIVTALQFGGPRGRVWIAGWSDLNLGVFREFVAQDCNLWSRVLGFQLSRARWLLTSARVAPL